MAAIIVFSDCISVELGTERESGDRVALLLLLLLWGKTEHAEKDFRAFDFDIVMWSSRQTLRGYIYVD